MKVYIIIVCSIIYPFISGCVIEDGDLNREDLPATAIEVSSDCSFNGFKLYGKVQFVDAFPDIKIQVVDAFPDLKVKIVDAFPDDCGEWQVVDAFPDIKVQVVDAFGDIKIQYVDAFPGKP